MDYLICKQGLFGGTDRLLEALNSWLILNGFSVDSICVDSEDYMLKEHYDLAILPSSQLGDILTVQKKGTTIESILIWVMGSGAFTDAYYANPPKRLFDRLLYYRYGNESKKTLKWLLKNNAIAFSDGVGLYNTMKSAKLDKRDVVGAVLLPIAIRVPSNNKFTINTNKNNNKLRISWIGRVSSDFKKIPLLYLIDDIQSFVLKNNIVVDFTIVGDGDAIGCIRKKASDVSYNVKFIDNISYDKLNDYILESVDLLIAMGTSALDGAKLGCPTIIINSVRDNDPQRVEYRWIYESVDYSLGEYPDYDIETGQPRHSLSFLIEGYLNELRISDKCYEYSKKFDEEVVFKEFIQCDMPKAIDYEVIKHIKTFYRMKKNKKYIKKLLNYK